MTHIGNAPFGPVDARRWPIGVRARRPFGPFLPVAVAIPEPLVIEAFRHALRGHAIDIEEARAVEMIRNRAVIVARRGRAQAEQARDSPECGETGEQAA